MNCIMILFALMVSMATAQPPQPTQQDLKANVVLRSYPESNVKGVITFTQLKDVVRITGNVSGLVPGPHGFHIHEKGDISNGCAALGPHFNPHEKTHGSPNDVERHVGDLGNIEADSTGVVHVDFNDPHISLISIKRNIIGRSVTVHEFADDLGLGGANDSKINGHAGARIACGVIGTLNARNSANVIYISPMKLIAFILSYTLILFNN